MEKRKFRTITLLADIIILTISFVAVVWTKPASLKSYIPSHTPFFLGLALIWIIVSLVNGKMHRRKIINFSTLFTRVLTSNVISVSITALAMYVFRNYAYSRTVVLGTALLATFLELVFGSIYMAYKKAGLQDYEEFDKSKTLQKPSEYDLVKVVNGNGVKKAAHAEVNPGIAIAIEKEVGSEIAHAILKMTSSNFADHISVSVSYTHLTLPTR